MNWPQQTAASSPLDDLALQSGDRISAMRDALLEDAWNAVPRRETTSSSIPTSYGAQHPGLEWAIGP